MQLKPILLTAALALASTTTVAAEWLPTSAEHNYAQYCQGKGSPTDDRYVCFQTASNSFAWQVSHVAQSRFKGYLGKDFNHFVILETPGQQSLLQTKDYRVIVRFGTVKGDEVCAYVVWQRRDHQTVIDADVYCRGDVVTLPGYF